MITSIITAILIISGIGIVYAADNEFSGTSEFGDPSTNVASGTDSVAFGYATTASNYRSAAFGASTTASGVDSIAFGTYTTASGVDSATFGRSTTASGINSATFGDSTTAQPLTSFVIGRYNEISGNTVSWIATDPLFVIGNGADSSNRNNAVTVLKNGNVGIGTSSPDADLAIDQSTNGWEGGIQFISQDNTSIWYIHSENNNGPLMLGHYGNNVLNLSHSGNVGIGTQYPSQKLDVNGDAIANSWLTHSSQKWKKDIIPLDNTLDKVTQIQGVTYKLRADEFPEMSFDDTIQIGFIAEELEIIYPELVYTTENGDKSIDYSKLTPILLEAIKEQQNSIEEQQDTINTQQEMFADQQDMINTQQDILEQLKTVICPEHPELSACP